MIDAAFDALPLIVWFVLPLASLAVLVAGLLRRGGRPAWLLWCAAAVSVGAISFCLIALHEGYDPLTLGLFVWFVLCLLVLGLALGRRRRGEPSRPMELAGMIMPVVVLLPLAALSVVALLDQPPKPLQPTEAELSQPDRADRLVGTWVYLGSVMLVDNSFSPGTREACTFRADGRCSCDGADRWEVDAQGLLHLWDSRGPSADGEDDDGWAEFFFRNGKLYLTGDSQWEVYRRQ